MAKVQITIPLEIPDVRVLYTSLNESGEIIIACEGHPTTMQKILHKNKKSIFDN